MKTRAQFLFFICLAVLCVALCFKLRAAEVLSFWQMRGIWWQAVVAGSLAGLLSAFIGYYLLPRRNLLMSMAMNQGAGLGIFLFFTAKAFIPTLPENELLPLTCGILFAILITQLLVRAKHSRFVTEESITGMTYVLASGLIILLSDHIDEGRHEIDQLLFGNAVAISEHFFFILVLGAALIFILHAGFFKHFLYSSLDEDFLKVTGIKTRRWLGLLYFTLALSITLATMTLGSLPVFALMVFPAYISLKSGRSPRGALLLCLSLGLLLPLLGYFLSFIFALPTGASIIALGGLYWLVSGLGHRLVHLKAK